MAQNGMSLFETVRFASQRKQMQCENAFGYNNWIASKVDRKHRAEGIELKIYDVGGRLVKSFSLPTVYSPDLAPRSGAGLLPTSVTWDGKDGKGKSVKAGVYFIKIATDGFTSVKKVVLVR